MPPPIIISLTLSSKLSISWILSATLAPPKMAKNGLKTSITKFHPDNYIKDATTSLDYPMPWQSRPILSSAEIQKPFCQILSD